MDRLLCVLMLIGFVGSVYGADEPKMGPPKRADGIPLQTCRIVAPEAASVREVVEDLARRLRERGATVSVASSVQKSGFSEKPDFSAGETLILVGNLVTNRALLPLYASVLDFTDAYYPGGDGYVVRTVLDAPGRGTDCLVLGGSTDEGTVKAVRRACEILAGLKPGQPFPRTLEVKLGGKTVNSLQWAWNASPSGDATSAGYLYGLCGQPKLAEIAKREFLKPDVEGGQRFYNISDYALEPRLRAWALVCDSPVFSQEEVQTVHQLLLNTLVFDQNMYWRARGGDRIGSRHQTMGTSAFLSVVNHLLRRGNPNEAALALLNRWKKECDAYFANAVTTFHDDLEGIPSYHSVQPIVNYALQNGVASYLKRPGGVSPLETAILRAYASVDNLGYYCGTGTYEEARPGTVKARIMLGYPLAIAACVNRDAQAAWLLRHFPGTGVSTWGLISGHGARAFDVGDAVPESEPRELLGVVRAPLGEYRYSRLSLPVPYERTYEKLCFRDTFAPDGQYLVLEGYQCPSADNAAPLDGNSIIRYTDRGHVWLIANSDRQGNFHRNAVFVSDGETSGAGWAGCELIGQASAGDAHLVVSKLGGYNGSEWTRSILWLRGKAFAVLDRVRFETPGDRQVFCTFRTAPAAELQGREWIARSGPAEFRLLNADEVPMTSRRLGPEGAAIPTVLRQTRAVKASAGSATFFRNLFYVSTPERPQKLETRPLGENAMLVMDATPRLFAVRGADSRLKAGPFESDAEALYLGPEGACLVGGTVLTLNGKPLALGPSPDARQALSALWQQTAAPSQPRTENQKPKTAPVWTYAGLTPRRPAILSPIVSATDVPGVGAPDDLVDGFIPLHTGDVRWNNPKGLTLTFDLRQSEDLSAVEFATGQIGSNNMLPTAEKMPKDRTVAAQFSDDGFEKDVRGGEAVFKAGFTIEPLHKGTVFPMGRWRLTDVNQRSRQVRLTFPPGPLALREVFIRRAKGTEARFGPGLVADLDGDGREEAVVTTDAGELAVLGPDGQKRWGHTFAGPVTCLKVEAASSRLSNHEKRQEVASTRATPATLLVGTWEARLYCFSADGRQQWMTDFTPLGGDLPVPFSIALTQPGADGKRGIIVGNYARVSFVSPDGKLLSHTFGYGAFETMTLTDGMDLTGDGVEDALVYNVWATMSVVDGAKRNAVRYIGCPRGEGLALRAFGGDAKADPAVLVASDNGLGVVRPVSGKYDWQKALSPMFCVVTADVDGDGQDEILVGKRDGWLLVLAGSGEVKAKAMIGDEVRAIVPLSKRLWLATGADVRVLDAKLATLATFSCPAQRIEALGKDMILVLGEDGAVSAFRADMQRLAGD